MITLALRSWLRYVVPLTVLGVIACAPLLYIAWTAKAPEAFAQARTQVKLAWVLAGVAPLFVLLLVAGVAPAVRALASGAPLSQLGALIAGLRGLARGFLPWLVAVAAIVLGGVALVVPGVLLAVLVSLFGASDQLRTSPQAAIADSLDIVRPQLWRIAAIVAAIVIVSFTITIAVQLMYVPLITKKTAVAKLAPIQMNLRIVTTAVVAVTPLAASFLAAAYSHAKRR